MSAVEFRPRFRCVTSLLPGEVAENIKKNLADNNPHRLKGSVLENHVHLKLPPDVRHFWSPQMDISIDRDEEGQTMIRCLLGPAPGVWTLFVFFYSLFGLAAIAGLMIWTSQLTLGNYQWGHWLTLGALVMGIIMHLISAQGKRLARDEMIMMKEYLQSIIKMDEEPV